MAKQRQIEGIEAEMPFAEAGAAVVETRATELVEHSRDVLDMTDIEGVHDMRVATRRLRAALEVFAPCFPRDAHKKLLKEVKAIADALGERRDRDVAIVVLSGFRDSIPRPDRPGLDSLIERYRDEQVRANEELVPFVSRERVEGVREATLALAAEARAAASADDRSDGAGAGP